MVAEWAVAAPPHIRAVADQDLKCTYPTFSHDRQSAAVAAAFSNRGAAKAGVWELAIVASVHLGGGSARAAGRFVLTI